MSEPSIRFLMPYFGRWPFWMPLFLESCRRNPDIDWLFFSDCGRPDGLPENVQVREIAYRDYLAFVSEKLELDFHPDHPYKLCDIKPTYGFVHEADLKDYDFWAFGDIDLIYGRLRAYYTPDRLNRYDLISSHARRVSGHLCLIRNEPHMREIFRNIPGWRELVCGPHEAVDEKEFSRIFLRHKNLPKPFFRFLNSFNARYRKSLFHETYSTPGAKIAWTDGSRNFPSCWFWEDGRLTNDKNKGQEFPYFHFVVWKKNEWAAQPEPSAESMLQLARQARWQISAKGFEGIA
jgi:hypothetical protein